MLLNNQWIKEELQRNKKHNLKQVKMEIQHTKTYGQRRINTNPKTLAKNRRGGNTLLTHYEASITLTPKPDYATENKISGQYL